LGAHRGGSPCSRLSAVVAWVRSGAQGGRGCGNAHMEIFVLFWIACAIAAAFVASSRGANGCLWAFLGFLLGPIGLLMSFASQSKDKCPNCHSGIDPAATRCPKCQGTLNPTIRWTKGGIGVPVSDSGVEIETARATKKCPDCAEEVRAEARKCRFCGFLFPEAPLEEPSQPVRAEAQKPLDSTAVALEPPPPSPERPFPWWPLIIALCAGGLIFAFLYYCFPRG
jgi:hypothetical protein